jgi:AcrR family transcriptional regulator
VPALVYHYFGSKEHLYLKVLEGAYRDFRQGDEDLTLTEVDPVTAIRNLAAFTVARLDEQRHFPSLVSDENLHNARHVRRSQTVRRLHSKLLEAIENLLERGRREAGFRADVDALQIYIAIAGLASFYVTNARTVEAIFGSRFRRISSRAALTQHVQDLIVRYLVIPGREADAPG